MRFPNMRYGDPAELRYYTQGVPMKDLTRQLRRSKKTISAWLNGDTKVPFWVPELVRLRRFEHEQHMRQMGIGRQRAKLGIVRGAVIDFNHAGTDQPKALAPHRPSLPHSYSDDSQNAIGADRDAQACPVHTRTFGTAPW